MKATPVRAGGAQAATFREVVGLIQSARARALQAVNTELIERVILAPPKVSAVLTQFHAATRFRPAARDGKVSP